MFNYKCNECDEGIIRERRRKNYTVTIDGSPFVMQNAKIGVCDHCGEVNYHGREMKRWRDLYDAWMVKESQVLSPKEILIIRSKLDLNQTEFAQLIGVSRQSLYCWESESRSRVQPQSIEKILRLINEELDHPNQPIIEGLIRLHSQITSKTIAEREESDYKNRNRILGLLLPSTTWRLLSERASQNKTDAYTEMIRVIETGPITEYFLSGGPTLYPEFFSRVYLAYQAMPVLPRSKTESIDYHGQWKQREKNGPD